MPDRPFVIAGAGIAGLALAGALKERGRPLQVYDERPSIGAGAAITLWPNALAALDELGVGADVRRAGHAVSAGAVLTPTGRRLSAMDDGRLEAALGGPLLVVRRGDLLDILLARVPVDALRLGTTVTGYRRAPSVRVDTADVTTRRTEEHQARALVGADGFRSVVARGLAGGELLQRYAGYPAWRAIAPVGGFEPVEVVDGRSEVGIVPLGPHATYWFATLREPPDSTAPYGEKAHLLAAFADWPDAVRAVLEATPADEIGRVDIVDRASPRRWTDGPVTVIGDAAHPMRPHLGQGGCQALVDVAVLARHLATTPDEATAFACYAAERRRRALRVVRLSKTAGRVLNSPLYRATSLVPQRLLLRQLASIAGTDRA